MSALLLAGVKFELCSFNHEISADETMSGAWSHPIHIGRLYEHKINILIILLNRTGTPCPKEVSNYLSTQPKETSMLKVN